MNDPDWLALAPSWARAELARALAREGRRNAYHLAAVDSYEQSNRTRLKRAFLRLAFLGLPGPEGDVKGLIKSLMPVEPYRQEEWYFRNSLAEFPPGRRPR